MTIQVTSNPWGLPLKIPKWQETEHLWRRGGNKFFELSSSTDLKFFGNQREFSGTEPLLIAKIDACAYLGGSLEYHKLLNKSFQEFELKLEKQDLKGA